jgi:hypothetical protein
MRNTLSLHDALPISRKVAGLKEEDLEKVIDLLTSLKSDGGN